MRELISEFICDKENYWFVFSKYFTVCIGDFRNLIISILTFCIMKTTSIETVSSIDYHVC
jgi:hypothetical protein